MGTTLPVNNGGPFVEEVRLTRRSFKADRSGLNIDRRIVRGKSLDFKMEKRDIFLYGTSAFTASTLMVLLYRYLNRRRKNVYETRKLVNSYLMFHYGNPSEVLAFDFGPKDAIDFPVRCAEMCTMYLEKDIPSTAIDIGCAVGRSTFELARHCQDVVGIDYSKMFIDSCNDLKMYGKLHYQVTTEGCLYSEHDAIVDESIDRRRVSFLCGDACNLPSDLGQFGCVLAANLICRLQNPYSFLERLPSLVVPGGIVVLTCPFTWLKEFTPKALWLGGYKDSSGNPVNSFDTIKRYLERDFELLETKDMPFFIRETARKNQWSVAQTSIWKRHKAL